MRRVFSRITLAMTAALCSATFSLFGAGSVQAQTTAEKTLILGAGSTFAAPLYGAWIKTWTKDKPNLSISYDAVGSARGSTVSSPGPPTSQAPMRR